MPEIVEHQKFEASNYGINSKYRPKHAGKSAGQHALSSPPVDSVSRETASIVKTSIKFHGPSSKRERER